MTLWLYLKKIFIAIGRVQTTLLMGLFYYLVLGPMAVVYQALRKKREVFDLFESEDSAESERPEGLRPEWAESSYWIEREEIKDWEKYLRRQF